MIIQVPRKTGLLNNYWNRHKNITDSVILANITKTVIIFDGFQ